LHVFSTVQRELESNCRDCEGRSILRRRDWASSAVAKMTASSDLDLVFFMTHRHRRLFDRQSLPAAYRLLRAARNKG